MGIFKKRVNESISYKDLSCKAGTIYNESLAQKVWAKKHKKLPGELIACYFKIDLK